ncbi:ABC transporter permease subunit [Spiroplasma endosymbiont of Amphimallon solstitiale]|uniref:ABC transporter permease subunit n=1 Tax=Spiroplasma endosymbiont of Amphimallon solstitiale TaxID=3066288 RepID=UPI00313BAF8D
MINFRFVKTQFKNVKIPLILFFIILCILIAPILTQDYLAPTITFIGEEHGVSCLGGLGAMTYFNFVFFGIPGLILIFSFSLILNHILVSKEIDKGYLASWLTMPMSRKTILNSKLFVLLSSILILYGSAFVFQLIIFPIRFQDFKLQEFGYLVLYNLGLILLALLWASINWTFISYFNKSVISLSVATGISTVFILFQIMTLFSSIPEVEYLKYFKYMTIASLLNSPFKFGDIPNITPAPGVTEVAKAPIFSIRALDFAWQYPIILIVPLGLFPLGNYFLIKKDLSL